jgi:hypothetical protein
MPLQAHQSHLVVVTEVVLHNAPCHDGPPLANILGVRGAVQGSDDDGCGGYDAGYGHGGYDTGDGANRGGYGAGDGVVVVLTAAAAVVMVEAVVVVVGTITTVTTTIEIKRLTKIPNTISIALSFHAMSAATSPTASMIERPTRTSAAYSTIPHTTLPA